MSNKPSLPNFGYEIDKSPYNALEPIVKIHHLTRGSHIIIGGAAKSDDVRNLAYLGKVLENSVGTSYLGANIWLDIGFPHVIYVSGTRGSGKSFDLGVLLEGISALTQPSPVQHAVEPQCSFLMDMQNQFWTLRYEPRSTVPENEVQLRQLERWRIDPNSLSDCAIFVPHGTEKLTGQEQTFTLSASEVLPEEWCALLGQPLYSPQGHVISKTIEQLQTAYSIADMVGYISDDVNWPTASDSTRSAVAYKLEDLARSRVFSNQGLDLKTLLVPGRCNVFMLRDIRDEDKSLVTAIIARQLFRLMGAHHSRRKIDSFFGRQHDDDRLPGKVWLFVDEAHIVAPKDAPSPARDALVEFVKRGRDAGLSLVLATQQPAAVDDRILSQVNLSLNHRLTFQSDITAAVNRIPTSELKAMKIGGATISDFGDMLRLLDSGECFVGDHSTSRAFVGLIRPRITSHGGYNPS